MFREVKLHTEEKDFHRFLWKNKQGHIKDLRMNRLTFGVRSSPFIATQVIRHLAQTHLTSHPKASQAIIDSFYVDDYLSGAPTVEEAIHIRTQLCDLLKHAGMNLRKWRTSDSAFKDTIPPDILETADLQISPGERPLKALGLHWNVQEDALSIAIPDIPATQKVTKRTIASNLGKVFDILGFYSPFTVTGKILLRKLWSLQYGWDAEPPDEIIQLWSRWKEQLPVIGSHQVSRRYSNSNKVVSQTLHGFADASQEAYGAVVYIQQTHDDGSSSTAIVIAKARVLPLKGLTIPRAELSAAFTLAKLMNYCSSILNIQALTAWSDSSIVLCWLRKSPTSLNSFVANRVRNTHQLIPQAQWRHVSSAFNPADMLSRGLTATDLISSDLWWKGPPWINLPPQQWPTPQFSAPKDLPEVKSVILAAPTTTEEKIWDRFSNFNHMIRILSWCRRYLHNLRRSPEARCKSPHLQAGECHKTRNHLILLSQQEFFPDAVKAAARDKPLPKGHALQKYKVFKDKDGPLLLSTRVRDFRDCTQPRKLIPLSIRSSLTRLLLQTLHICYLHPGTNNLLSIVNHNY